MYKCVCNRSREQDGTRTRLANFSFHFLKKFSLIHRTMELKLCSGQFLVTRRHHRRRSCFVIVWTATIRYSRETWKKTESIVNKL